MCKYVARMRYILCIFFKFSRGHASGPLPTLQKRPPLHSLGTFVLDTGELNLQAYL